MPKILSTGIEFKKEIGLAFLMILFNLLNLAIGDIIYFSWQIYLFSWYFTDSGNFSLFLKNLCGRIKSSEY